MSRKETAKTISDLPEVIADINKRLANGEMPQTR